MRLSQPPLSARLRRLPARLLAGTVVHRLYSSLRGSSSSWLRLLARRGSATRTERLQHGLVLTDEQIQAGEHRQMVGGRWDEIGRVQFDFLIAEGLKPEHHLLDVGCGALRAGVHLVGYLEPGHYFGIDINESLLRAGRWELSQLGLEDRCPESNLRVTDSFDCDFGVDFDFAIAQSLFTHIPLAAIERCLTEVAKVMKPGGRFFTSYNGLPPGRKLSRPSTRDPFRHAYDDLAALAATEWTPRYIPDWGHPRGMQMMEFRRN